MFLALTSKGKVNDTFSPNMADKQFLPVDALARQQLNSRALTAHSKFMVDD